VTFVFTVIVTVMYLLTLAVYQLYGNTEAELWQRGSWHCTLYDFQAKFSFAIAKQGQLWRLITPIFLHNNTVHLFWNVISLFMIGFTVEKMMPSKLKFSLFIVLGGSAANLLSAVAGRYHISVGSSGVVFTMLGALVLWFTLNFKAMGGF